MWYLPILLLHVTFLPVCWLHASFCFSYLFILFLSDLKISFSCIFSFCLKRKNVCESFLYNIYLPSVCWCVAHMSYQSRMWPILGPGCCQWGQQLKGCAESRKMCLGDVRGFPMAGGLFLSAGTFLFVSGKNPWRCRVMWVQSTESGSLWEMRISLKEMWRSHSNILFYQEISLSRKRAWWAVISSACKELQVDWPSTNSSLQ